MLCKSCKALLKLECNLYERKVLSNSPVLSHFWCFDYRNAFGIIQKSKYSQETSHYRHLMSGIDKDFFRKITSLHIDLLVPIPTQLSHVEKRGIDHTLKLTKEISKITSIQSANVLMPSRSFQQVHSRRNERLKSPSYFALRKINAKTVLLVDDVASTFSSISAAAKTLKSMGVVNVYAFTLAYSQAYTENNFRYTAH